VFGFLQTRGAVSMTRPPAVAVVGAALCVHLCVETAIAVERGRSHEVLLAKVVVRRVADADHSPVLLRYARIERVVRLVVAQRIVRVELLCFHHGRSEEVLRAPCIEDRLLGIAEVVSGRSRFFPVLPEPCADTGKAEGARGLSARAHPVIQKKVNPVLHLCCRDSARS
jgi:hypothetical protein